VNVWAAVVPSVAAFKLAPAGVIWNMKPLLSAAYSLPLNGARP